MLAGIVGGKGIPASVANNPLVFVTLTAPSFGAVHRVAKPGDASAVCHKPGKRARTCRHGRARFCTILHDAGDPIAGSPLCPECYDYAGQVLFNALASRAWKALTDNLYHHLAKAAGLSCAGVRERVRIEYLRVAEYQARGAIHFHVVMRLDGPEGPGSPVPAWASGELLCAAVRSAVAVTTVRAGSAALGERVFRFGTQADAVVVDFAGSGFSPQHVAAYLAKYVTKGTEDVGGADVVIRHRSRIAELGRNAHVRALMYAAWDLGRVPDLADMRMRAWCHTLGYRGRVVTASRGFSVTFKDLRAVRAAFMAAERGVDTSSTVAESHFSYAGHGFGSPLLEEWAAELREDAEERRLLARDRRWPGRWTWGSRSRSRTAAPCPRRRRPRPARRSRSRTRSPARRRSTRRGPAAARVGSTGMSPATATASALDLAAERGGMARLCVLRGGESLVDVSLGCAPDTLFLLFSAGKPLTALAVHHLAERGLIDLDAPVWTYWPAYAAGGKLDVSVRHVLRHRSGAPTSTGSIVGDARIMTDWDRSIAAAERAHPRWPAGEVPAYHILNYGFVLGELVRRVSGVPLAQYAREALLDPLGLGDTHIGLPHNQAHRLAPLRVHSGGLASLVRSAYFNRPAVREAVVPAATVTATAPDVARLYRMLLLGGTIDGVRVLRPETLQAALRPTTASGEKDRLLRIPVRWAEGFQLGGAVGRSGTAMGTSPDPETFGHNGSYVCSAWADPVRDLVCVYLTNLVVGRADGERHHAAVSDAVLREFG